MKVCDNCAYWCPCCHFCRKYCEVTTPFRSCEYHLEFTTDFEDCNKKFEEEYFKDEEKD